MFGILGTDVVLDKEAGERRTVDQDHPGGDLSA
jgi:hypothetical protein